MGDVGWYPNVLVLGPGGIKAFLELGSLIHIENLGLLKNINWYIGVSAGAIVSYLLVLGYTVSESINICLKYNVFPDLKDINIQAVKENHGLLSTQNLKKILVECTIDKFGMNLTMEELYQATGLEFTVVTVNVDERRPDHSQSVYLNHENEPDLEAVDAVLFSANIPGVFYKKVHLNRVLVDGALGNPYPINICDRDDNQILGIYITNCGPDDNMSAKDNWVYYLEKIIVASMTELRINIIKQSSDRCRHLALYGYSPDPIGISTTEDQKIKMIISGYKTAIEYMKSIGFEV